MKQAVILILALTLATGACGRNGDVGDGGGIYGD